VWILIGLVISGTAAILMLAVNAPLWIAAGAGVAGFGFGAVFPRAVAMFCDSALHFTSIIFASGALGGATLPLAVGWTVSKSGDYRAGLAFAVCSICTMIALEVAIRRHLKALFPISRYEPDASLYRNPSVL
jgi:nitrate/nitrite transporter NarK